MGLLIFKVKEKNKIIFEKTSLDFERGTLISKNLNIPYTSGTGQSFSSGQILYSISSINNDGYILITSRSNQSLIGSGYLEIKVEHRPSSTQYDQVIMFDIDNVNVIISFKYNSKPMADDIEEEIDNRSIYTFDKSLFLNNYSDIDGDSLAAIMIFGNVTNFKYNGLTYIEGTEILIDNIHLLTYQSLDQDDYYESNNTWKAVDSNGNISNI